MEHEIITDIDTLIKLRIDYIAEEIALSEKDKEVLIPHLREYFEEHLTTGDFFAYVILEDGEIVSTAFLAVSERPPGLFFLNGRIGTVMNVMTYPAYRGKGYATAVISDLMIDADMQCISVLDLYATDMGKSLYEKLGFETVPYTAMMLKQQKR